MATEAANLVRPRELTSRVVMWIDGACVVTFQRGTGASSVPTDTDGAEPYVLGPAAKRAATAMVG